MEGGDRLPEMAQGPSIPIVPVYGKRYYVDGQERWQGYVEKRKDRQRLYNSNVSRLADAPLPGGKCRGLLVGAAGTANLMEQDGTIRTNVPLQQGYNPLIVRQVRLGGTAADIWALY